MKRKEFLKELKEELRKRRDIETEEVLFYYDELIQDAVENGESEDVFIINLGSVKDIVRRIEDDEEFKAEVKGINQDALKNAFSITVRVIGYAILGLVAFMLGTASFSLFVSGISMVFGSIIKMIFSSLTDVYSYLALFGVVLIGSSLIVFSVALVKWFIDKAKPSLLAIFRNTKEFLNRKGK